MRSILFGVAAFGLAVGVTSRASGDFIPLGSSVQATVNPTANADSESANQQQSQGATLNPLAASVSTTAQGPSNFGGYATNTNYASVSESFNNANSGVVSFSGVGWDTTSTGSSQGGVDSLASSTYTFNTAGNTALNISYVTSGMVNTFGGLGFSPGFVISIYDYPQGFTDPGDQQLFSGSGYISIGQSGTLSVMLSQPGDYALWITAEGSNGGGLPVESADAIGTFNFSTPSAVPEPASIMMVGIGTLGLLGYGRLRRKKAVA